MSGFNGSSKVRRLLRALALTFGLAIGFSGVANAINSDVWILPCANCSAVNDFRLAAMQAAASPAAPGLYIVSSQSMPRTAYVRVTGTPHQICDMDGVCSDYLGAIQATVIDETNTAVTGTGKLEEIDVQTFGLKRGAPLPTVTMNTAYASSFINTEDDGLMSPWINVELSLRGINVGLLYEGTLVMVKFADGTSAQFFKYCNCDDMWHWTGRAWDAQGRPMNRDGTLKSNPNTSGSVRGSGTFYSTEGSSMAQFRMGTDFFGVQSNCLNKTEVWIDGHLASTFTSIVPC